MTLPIVVGRLADKLFCGLLAGPFDAVVINLLMTVITACSGVRIEFRLT